MGKIKMPSVGNIVKTAINPVATLNNTLGSAISPKLGGLMGPGGANLLSNGQPKAPQSVGAFGTLDMLTRPGFQSMIDPSNGGMLKKDYTLGDKFNSVNLNQEGLTKFRGEALRDSSTQSPWAKMQAEKNNAMLGQEINNLSASNNAQQRGAMNDLASQGGLSGGARLALTRSGIRDSMNQNQNARFNTNTNNMNVGIQDEQNRINMLQQLPGMEIQNSGFLASERDKGLAAKEFDIRNALNETNLGRIDSVNNYDEQMKKFAANQSADAMKSYAGRSSGKGGK